MTMFDDKLAATIAHARRHTLGDLVRRTASRAPDKTALIHRDLRQSYAELDATINRTANALAQRGVVKGERIALLSHNNHAYVITCLALARLGAITVRLTSCSAPRRSHSFSNTLGRSVSSSRTRWSRSPKRRSRRPVWAR